MIDYFMTQHLIEEMVAARIVPGVNYAFIKRGQVFASTVGFSGVLPTKTQLSPFSDYDLASLTKVLGTTNVFLQLYEHDKLNFSEPLCDFLPDFRDKRVRLFHLLTHTSGIRGWIPNRDGLNTDQLLAAITHLPVTDEFETRVRYADTNFILLGLVLQAYYHQSVQKVITSQILKPMRAFGVTQMTFHPQPNQCVPTALGQNGRILQGRVHDPKARVLGKQCASAGLFANLEDLILMVKGYLGLNRKVLPVSQKILASLFEIKTPHQVAPRSWGWDVRLDPLDHHVLLCHTGFTGTLILMDRLNQSALILLTNRIYPSGHNQLFLTMRQHIISQFITENHA